MANVRVSAIVPPGGPLGEATAVTLTGTGFATYGDGQLVVSYGSGALASSLPAVLLGATRALCTLPAPPSAATAPLKLSLNGGAAGTFTGESPFTAYVPPRLDAVFPTEGSAQGGTSVTITGGGFEGLSSAAAPLTWRERNAYLRCRFGGEVQPQPPIYHNNTHVVCSTTWGDESEAGQLVSISLNGGASFASAAGSSAPRFYFRGLRPPVLVDAYFPAAMTTLVARFDRQPTNRGGMNGIGPCSAVLDDATSSALRGGAAAEAQCDWSDDSTLVAFLTMDTAAVGGMTVGIRSDVVWPKEYSAGCGPTAQSMCARAFTAHAVSNQLNSTQLEPPGPFPAAGSLPNRMRSPRRMLSSQTA